MPNFAGQIRQLGATASAMTLAANQRAQGALGASTPLMVYNQPSNVIGGGLVDPNHWPTASQPVTPIGRPDATPLALQYWYGQNLTYVPRADAQYSAAQLRAMGQYFLARVCMENVKDIVAGINWQIQLKPQLGEPQADLAKRSKGDKNIAMLMKFFERPGGREYDWGQFARRVLEDMLVVDAGCCYVQRTKGKQVYRLIPLEGEFITRYIDDSGLTPEPPYAAYAQLWEGMPRVNLTSDQLVYRPRNIAPRNSVSSRLYGLSPTEQAADVIKIGIQKLYSTLTYFTRGSVPDTLWIVPANTDPKQVDASMRLLNSQLAGNLAERHQIRLVQGFQPEGKAEQLHFTKPEILADALDDLLVREICFTYGCSPQRLLRMQNRATAQSNQEAAEEEGNKPWVDWLKSFVDYLITFVFLLPDYEVGFAEDQENDLVKRATAMETLFTNGMRTLDEVRDFDGLDPSGIPEGKKFLVKTAQGMTPIDAPPPAAPGVAPGAQPGAPPANGNGKPNPKDKVALWKAAQAAARAQLNARTFVIPVSTEVQRHVNGHA